MKKYLIFTIIFLVSAFSAEFFLLEKGGTEIAAPFERLEKAPRPIKTLILGHCEAASGIAPAYLGKQAFNFAMNDMTFFYTRKLLQQVIKKSDVESVIIAVNPMMLFGKYKFPPYTRRYLWFKKGIAPPAEDLVSTAFTFGNHARLLNDKLNQYFFKEKVPFNHSLQFSPAATTVPLQEIKQDTYFQDGFRALTPSYDPNKTEQMLDEMMKNFDLSQNVSEADEFLAVLSILKDSSIKTTILLLPQVQGLKDQIEKRAPGAEKKLQDTLSEIRKQYPHIRIHDIRSNHGIPDNLFALPNIVSSKGADLLGMQLRTLLIEQH